jgi:hypothetical protein
LGIQYSQVPHLRILTIAASPLSYEDFEEGLLITVFPSPPKHPAEKEKNQEKVRLLPANKYFL